MSDPIEERLAAWATDELHMGQSVRMHEPTYPNPGALRRDVRAALEALAVLRGRLAEAERTCRDEEAQAYQNGRLSAKAEMAEMKRLGYEANEGEKRLEAENDSLKEALREIGDELWSVLLSQPPVLSERQHKGITVAREVARAALASSEGEGDA